MDLRELIDKTLAEIDRQIKASPKPPTPEQSLIWTTAASELSAVKARLYTKEHGQ